MKPAQLACAIGLALVAACSTPDPDQRTVLVAPDRASFDPVAAYIDHRCGSLDCHGSRYRNLRMWSHDGMRLAIGDVPGGTQTSADENDATYTSVIDLEPEILSAVVSVHGASPERLTLVRKARGTDKHAGGTILAAGDPRDRCIVSWLEGATDTTACTAAMTLP